MAKSSWNHALVWVSLVGALAGCSTVPDSQPPAAGPPMKIPDAATTSDEPVPQAEPPSRSGNPDTYVVFGRRYRVKETSAGYREQGIASWYGRDFHGRKTSSGPPFNMFDLTAAHKSLPLPTYVRVTNLENGRNTVVKVTDRGPFVGRRLIDLSYAAADRLGILQRGTAPVEVVAVAPYQSLPKLTARRVEQQERLASRALRAKPETEVAEIEFAHATPIRPSTQAPGSAAGATCWPAWSGTRPRLRPPVRLAQADVKRAAPKASAKVPVRLALVDVERAAPKAVAKTANVKLARAEDDRNPGRMQHSPVVRRASAERQGKPWPNRLFQPPTPTAMASRFPRARPAIRADGGAAGQPEDQPVARRGGLTRTLIVPMTVIRNRLAASLRPGGLFLGRTSG